MRNHKYNKSGAQQQHGSDVLYSTRKYTQKSTSEKIDLHLILVKNCVLVHTIVAGCSKISKVKSKRTKLQRKYA